MWIWKGAEVTKVSYDSPFPGFGTVTYDGHAYYVFIKELRRACDIA